MSTSWIASSRVGRYVTLTNAVLVLPPEWFLGIPYGSVSSVTAVPRLHHGSTSPGSMSAYLVTRVLGLDCPVVLLLVQSV